MTGRISLPRGARCARHPGRLAVDRCPHCERPRCGQDVITWTDGCATCVGDSADSTSPLALPASERIIRASLAAYAVAMAGGLVASEYVGATVFAYLGPFVVGVLCGGAGVRAGQTDGGHRVGRQVRALSAGYALLGTALGFLLEGSHRPLTTQADVLLPYGCAVAGALLWTRPPRGAQGRSTEV